MVAAVTGTQPQRRLRETKNPGPATQPRISRVRLPGSGAIGHYRTLPLPPRIGSLGRQTPPAQPQPRCQPRAARRSRSARHGSSRREWWKLAARPGSQGRPVDRGTTPSCVSIVRVLNPSYYAPYGMLASCSMYWTRRIHRNPWKVTVPSWKVSCPRRMNREIPDSGFGLPRRTRPGPRR
jgi:hypothetical protein